MQKMKKATAAGLMILCMILLAGWGKRAVELLNNTPLIDLSKAIKEAPIGNPGGSLSLEESRAPLPVQEKEKKQYRIKIKDTTITYKNRVCDMDDLKDKIIHDCGSQEAEIYLEDDYAEAHVYREVLAMLKELKESIGLEYQAEQ